MVAHDEEFKINLARLSDEELQQRRLKFVGGLYAGYKGSIDNVEKESLIKEIDIERETRFKRNADNRSKWALLISVISLVISITAIVIKFWL